jgi:hypothetical protein
MLSIPMTQKCPMEWRRFQLQKLHLPYRRLDVLKQKGRQEWARACRCKSLLSKIENSYQISIHIQGDSIKKNLGV